MLSPNPQQLLTLLEIPKRIAVVGASPNESRPSNWISRFLMSRGYEVIPVNPGHERLFDRSCYADVVSIPETVDIVNIFRRSDQVLPIVKAAIERGDVSLIWMQDNVYHPEAAELASAAGIHVVMNDCIYRFLNRS